MLSVRANSLKPGDTILVTVPRKRGVFDRVRIRSITPTTTTVRTEHGLVHGVAALAVEFGGWGTVYLPNQRVTLVRELIAVNVGRLRVELDDGVVQVWDTSSPYYNPLVPTTTARWDAAIGCHDAYGASLAARTWDAIDAALAEVPS